MFIQWKGGGSGKRFNDFFSFYKILGIRIFIKQVYILIILLNIVKKFVNNCILKVIVVYLGVYFLVVLEY